MRFMIIRKADENTEAGVMPGTELLEAMGNYTEQMVRAGVLLAGDGLQPSARGVRVAFAGGAPTVLDGPFAETKELIAGYYLIEVSSLDEAIEWVKRWPAAADGDPEIEIRQVFEAADFGEEFTPEQREKEERMRAEIGDRA
jgi:hypothetical protein